MVMLPARCRGLMAKARSGGHQPAFQKPIDANLFFAMLRNRLLPTVEDHVQQGGFAAPEVLAEHGVTGVTILRHALPDANIEHGAQKLLRRDFGLMRSVFPRRSAELYSCRQQREVTSLHRDRAHTSRHAWAAWLSQSPRLGLSWQGALRSTGSVSPAGTLRQRRRLSHVWEVPRRQSGWRETGRRPEGICA
jgi:hypothetical protein